MIPRLRTIPAWLIVLAVITAVFTVPVFDGALSGVKPAHAEEKRRGFNIFAPLFRRNTDGQQHKEIRIRPRTSRKDVTVTRKKPSTTRSTTRRTSSDSAPVARRTVTKTPKNPDARVILVIGDFIASGLARGLSDSYAENPTINVVERTMASSGIVRDDHFDWMAEGKKALEEEQNIVLVAVVMGANDSQPFRVNGSPSLTFRSDEWVAEYKKRATALMKLFNDAGKRVVWLSVPPMERSSLSANIAFMNDLQEQAAADLPGVAFVDVWNGFADENGRYISTGPDENGQVRRLRSSDGINLATAGRSKIAFYARQEIDKVLGGTVSAIAALQVTPDVAATSTEEKPVRPDVWEMVLTGETTQSAPVDLAGASSCCGPFELA